MQKRKVNLNTLYFSDQLQAELRDISRHALALVVAPMGYGKTTAVNWYLGECAQQPGTRVVRISVYSGSLPIFWQSVQYAFDLAGIDVLRGYGCPQDAATTAMLVDDLNDALAGPDACYIFIDDFEVTVNANGMMDMSALSGSGIEVDLYGNNLNDLNTAAGQVVDLLNSVDGIANASDGQENGDEEINISIDKDKAMRMGLTVAQVYQQVAAKLTTDTTATTLKANGTNYTVTIVDKTETPDLDSLFNMEFETTTTDEDGNSVKETHTLGEFATRTTSAGFVSIARENGSRKMSVTSETVDGYNTTLLSREVEPKLAALDLPDGVSAELAGETTEVAEMLQQMVLMMTLALISLMGFLVLMGVVVNNGIVFVDYANQLRIGGLERTDALVAPAAPVCAPF